MASEGKDHLLLYHAGTVRENATCGHLSSQVQRTDHACMHRMKWMDVDARRSYIIYITHGTEQMKILVVKVYHVRQ